jgi:hypothetical protein
MELAFLATPGDLIEDVMKLRWGNLARRLLQLRKTKISAHGAEMKLPGSEIAYVTVLFRSGISPLRLYLGPDFSFSCKLLILATRRKSSQDPPQR